MKKMIAFALTLAAFNLTYAMSFNDPFKDSNLKIVRQGDVFKLVYPEPCQAPVQIAIYDKRGTEIYSEILDASNGFIRPYNMSELPRGDYKICVTDNSGERTEEINTHKESWGARIVRLNTPEEKYLISIPNQNDGKATISIYDTDSRILYKDEVKTKDGFATVFVLKEIPGGALFKLFNHQTGEEFNFVTE